MWWSDGALPSYLTIIYDSNILADFLSICQLCMIHTSYNFSPFLTAFGLTLTSKQMDWPDLKLPDDGDTVHRSPSLLSLVDTIVAEQSNHQFTSSFKLLRQYKLSSPTALSITICEGRQKEQLRQTTRGQVE